MFGLVSQLRRASASIPTNIAEGSGRKSEKEFIQFLSIALGSANEVDYLIELSKDLGFISQEIWTQLDQEINEIQSMLFVLIRNKSERS
ncbi:four helix bundle protein [Roseivirga sp.]|nr:four helix bundle protein [Roseivirga sp.]